MSGPRRLVDIAAQWILVAAVYAALGIMLALGCVDAIEREMDHRMEMGRQAKNLAREMGLVVAVDNPVERLGAAVSNSLDIDLSLPDKHPHGASTSSAAMCGKPL